MPAYALRGQADEGPQLDAGHRPCRDKPGGLIVDFIGIGHSLKEAARKYTSGGFGRPTEDLDVAAKAQFLKDLDAIRIQLPKGVDLAGWRDLSNKQMEDMCSRLFGWFTEIEQKRDQFLGAEKRVSAAFSLVHHLDDCRDHADEVVFYQILRAELKKTLPGQRPGEE